MCIRDRYYPERCSYSVAYFVWVDALEFQLEQLGRSSESPITLNCPTTGLPPTAMFWEKGGEDLVSGGTYEIITELRDRQTTSFDNFLRINQTPQQAEGIYRCQAVNALDGPVQEGAEITRGAYTNTLLSLTMRLPNSYLQNFHTYRYSLHCNVPGGGI